MGIASDEKKDTAGIYIKEIDCFRSGADIIIPDYSEYDKLVKFLFCE
jgi:hypothetical protein